jgi:hypothetical protein
MRFPSKPHPRKQGSTIGRRKFFSAEGSADAGVPGTKTELRRAKHRVATVQCTATSASGHRCQLKAGHEGSHRLASGHTMQTAGRRNKTGRFVSRG